MDFQVLKRNKRGQASVEYILLIVVISSLVVGLTSFNKTIEQKFKDAKLGLRDKLAGQSELTRKDFFSGKITVNEGAGGKGKGQQGGGAGGAGGGQAGAAGAKKGTTGEEAGTGLAGTRGGGDTTEEQKPENTPEYREKRQEQEKEDIARTNRAAQEYREQQQTEEDIEQEKEREAISERQLALASEEDRARLLRRAKEEGLTTEKQKELEARNWKIGKFIIIIMLLLFVFVIILKTRQGRD